MLRRLLPLLFLTPLLWLARDHIPPLLQPDCAEGACKTTTTTTTTTTTAATTTTTLNENFTARATCKGAWLLTGNCDTGDTTCEDLCAGASQDNANNATTTGTPPRGQTTMPANTNADQYYLALTGGDYAEIADSTALESMDFSVSMWAYWDTVGDQDCFACKGYSATGDWSLMMADNGSESGWMKCWIGAWCDGDDGPGAGSAWKHLVWVYDGTADSVEYFVNGASIGSATGLSPANFTSASPLRLGADTDVNNPMNGRLYEVAYFAAKLSTADICQICECSLRGTDVSAARTCGACNTTCD